jgi:hypothetical protein
MKIAVLCQSGSFKQGGAAMKPGETIRFVCGDCQIVFDLNISPPSEWPEQLDLDNLDGIEPTCCPFCGAAELKKLHDRAVLGSA